MFVLLIGFLPTLYAHYGIFADKTIVSIFSGSTPGDVEGSISTAKFQLSTLTGDVACNIVELNGTLYVPERQGKRIKRITAGTVTRWAMDLGDIGGIAVNNSGFAFITSPSEHTIKMIYPNGTSIIIAGSGTPGLMDGVGWAADFNTPTGIVLDSNNNLFVADMNGYAIRRIQSNTWAVTTVAGGTFGSLDGTGSAASFQKPTCLTIDASNVLYVTDGNDGRIRRITSSGVVTTFAGSYPGYKDAFGLFSRFNNPGGIAVRSNGVMYVADTLNNVIRMITPDRKVRTIAGTGSFGQTNGAGDSSLLQKPFGLLLSGSTLYVTFQGSDFIKAISLPTVGGKCDPFIPNVHTTLNCQIGAMSNLTKVYISATGTSGTTFSSILSPNYPSGNISLNLFNLGFRFTESSGTTTISNGATSYNYQATFYLQIVEVGGSQTVAYSSPILLYDSNPTTTPPFTNAYCHNVFMTTFAGQEGGGDQLGPAPTSSFRVTNGVDGIRNIFVDSLGIAYVPDRYNGKIKRIFNGTVSEWAVGLSDPSSIALARDGSLYFTSVQNNRVGRVALDKSISYPIGSGLTGFSNAAISSSTFNNSIMVVTDRLGIVYVSDTGNNAIRRITTDFSSIETFVGSGAFSALDGTGTAATFASPDSIAFDSKGNLYISDSLNHRIRRVDSGGIVTTLTGSTAGFVDGVLSAAKFNNPDGIAIDRNDIIYVADQGNNRIRMILPHGEVRTIAGGSTSGNVNGVGCSALLNAPIGVSVGGDGNLYVTSLGNNQIKRLTFSPLFTRTGTIAGSKEQTLEGYISNAQFNNPNGLGFDADGNLYVAETGGNRIRKINTHGYASTFAGSSTASTLDGLAFNAGFNAPTALFVHTNGTVFVADNGNSLIRRITTDGVSSTLPGTFTNVRDMKLAADGSIYVIEAAGALKKIVSTGSSSTIFTFTSANCINVASLAISPDGNINVFSTNPYYCTVNSSGSYIGRTEFECEVCGGHSCTSVVSYSSGFICASNIDHTITLVSSSGRCSLIAGSCNNPGFGDGASLSSVLNAPSGMTLDGFGNLYVSESGNDRLRRIAMGNILCDYTFVADAPTLACEYFGTEPAVIALSSSSSISGLQFGGRNNTVTGPGKFRMDVSKVGYFLTYVNSTTYRLNTNTSTGFLANRNLFVAAIGSSILFSPPVRVVDPSPGIYPKRLPVSSSTSAVSYRYLRWFIRDTFNTATIGLQAMEFMFYLNGVQLTAPGNVASSHATCNTPNQFPNSLYDNSRVNKWCSLTNLNVSVYFNFSSPITFDAYTWVSAEDFPDRDPKNWQMFGSSNNSTWEFIHSVSSYTVIDSQARIRTQPIFYLNNTFKSVKDTSGSTYVIDAAKVAIQKITSAGVRTTFAGSNAEVAGMTDATGTSARFQAITGIAIDPSNNLYVSEGTPNNRIRKITSGGVVTSLVTGLNNPKDIVYSPRGFLVVADTGNHRLVRVNLDGSSVQYAGRGTSTCTSATMALYASFNQPQSLYSDGVGNIYMTSACRSIDIIYTNGSMTTVAGSRLSGFSDGSGDVSLFSDDLPLITMNSSNVLQVVDNGNNRIRNVPISGNDNFASSNVIYVRNSLVNGIGTKLSPRNNPTSVLTTAPSGSIVRFCNGDIYTLPASGITIPNSITIDSYDCLGDDSTPSTFTQATPIPIQPTIITKNGVTVWSFNLSSIIAAGKDVGALWINNKRYVLARYPNLKDPLILTGAEQSEYIFRTQHINSTILVPPPTFKNIGDYWLGASIRYKYTASAYVFSRINFYSNSSYTVDGEIFTTANLNGFYLENIEGELDFPGEFFYNRTTRTLFIVPMANEEWKLPTRLDQGLWLLHADGHPTPLITIEPNGWSHFGSTWSFIFSSNSQMKRINFDKAFFGVHGYNDLTVENVSMTRILDDSIRIRQGNLSVINDCYFEWVDGAGITSESTGTDLSVTNSTFRNIQMNAAYIYPVCLYQMSHTKTTIIENCLFENIGGTAVHMYSPSNYITNNVFRNLSLVVSRTFFWFSNPNSALACYQWPTVQIPCSDIINPSTRTVIANNVFDEYCPNSLGTTSFNSTSIDVLPLTFPNAQIIGNTFVTRRRNSCFTQISSGIYQPRVRLYNSMTLSRNAFIDTIVLVSYSNVTLYMNDFLPFSSTGETNYISTLASNNTIARGNLFCNNRSTYTPSNTLMEENTIITDGNCYTSGIAYVSNSTVPPTAHLIHGRGVGATPASSGSLEQISTLSNRTVYIPRGETYTRNSIQFSSIFSSNLTWTPMIGVDGSNTSFPVFTEATPFSTSPDVLNINGQLVWRYNLTQTNQIEAVWVDGVEYQLARYPNKDSLFGRPSSSNFEYVRARLNATSFMPDVSLKNRSSYWVGARIQIRLLNDTWTTATIMNYSDGTFTLDREIFDIPKTLITLAIDIDDNFEGSLGPKFYPTWITLAPWCTGGTLNTIVSSDRTFAAYSIYNGAGWGGTKMSLKLNNTQIDQIPSSSNQFYVTNIWPSDPNWDDKYDWTVPGSWIYNFSNTGDAFFLYPNTTLSNSWNYLRRDIVLASPRLDYYIENLLTELDAPGEYYADSNYLYIVPRDSNWSPPITTDQGVWVTYSTKGYKATPMGWNQGGQVSFSGLRFDKMSNGLSLSPTSLTINNSIFSNMKAAALFIDGGVINVTSTSFTNISNYGVFITDATSVNLSSLTLKNIGQVDGSPKRFALGSNNWIETIGIYVDADSVVISTSTIESIGGSVLQSNAKQGLLDRVFISDTNTFIQDTPIKLSGNWTIVDNTLQGFNTPIHPRDDGVVTAMTVQGQTLVIQRNNILSSSFNLSQVQITGSCDISGNVFTNIKLVLDSKNASINSNRFIPTDNNALGVPTGIEPTTSSFISSLSNNTFCNKRSSMLAISNSNISTDDSLINTNGECNGLILTCLPLTAGVEPTVTCMIEPFQAPSVFQLYISPTADFNDAKLLMNTTSLLVQVPFVTLGYDFKLATQDATGNSYYLSGPSGYQSATSFDACYMFASTADNALNVSSPIPISDPTLNVTCNIQQIIPGSTTTIPCFVNTTNTRSQINYHLSSGTTSADILLSSSPTDYNSSVLAQYAYSSKYSFTRSNGVWSMAAGASSKVLSNVVYVVARTKDGLAYGFSSPITILPPTISVTCQDRISPFGSDLIACSVTSSTSVSQVRLYLSFTNDISQAVTGSTTVLMSYLSGPYSQGNINYRYKATPMPGFSFTRTGLLGTLIQGGSTTLNSTVSTLYMYAQTTDGFTGAFSNPMQLEQPSLRLSCLPSILYPGGSDQINCTVSSNSTTSTFRLYLSPTNSTLDVFNSSTSVLSLGSTSFNYQSLNISFIKSATLWQMRHTATSALTTQMYVYGATTDGLGIGFSAPIQLQAPNLGITCSTTEIYPGGSDIVNCTASSTQTLAKVRLYIATDNSTNSILYQHPSQNQSLGDAWISISGLGYSFGGNSSAFTLSSNLISPITLSRFYIYVETVDGYPGCFSDPIELMAPSVALQCSSNGVYLDAIGTISCIASSNNTNSPVKVYASTSNSLQDVFINQPIGNISSGLQYQTYTYGTGVPNLNAITPLTSGVASSVNFIWGSGSILNTGQIDNIVVKFFGFLKVPVAAVYNLATESDDGAMLIVNGITVVSYWVNTATVLKNGTIYLPADILVPIEVWYFDSGSGANIILKYEVNGAFTVVPSSFLYWSDKTIPQSTFSINMTQTTHNFSLTDQTWSLTAGGKTSEVGPSLYFYAKTIDGFADAFSGAIPVLNRNLSLDCTPSVIVPGSSDEITCTSNSTTVTTNITYYIATGDNKNTILFNLPLNTSAIGTAKLYYRSAGFNITRTFGSPWRLVNTGVNRTITSFYIYAQTANGAAKIYSKVITINDPVITVSCVPQICPSDADNIACSVNSLNSNANIRLFISPSPSQSEVFYQNPSPIYPQGSRNYSLKANEFFFNQTSSAWTISNGYYSNRPLNALYVFAVTADEFIFNFSMPISLTAPTLSITCLTTPFDPITPQGFTCSVSSSNNVLVDLTLSTSNNITGADAFFNESTRFTLSSNIPYAPVFSSNPKNKEFSLVGNNTHWLLQSATMSRWFTDTIYICGRTADRFTSNCSNPIPLAKPTLELPCSQASNTFEIGVTKSINCTLSSTKTGVPYKCHLSASNNLNGVVRADSPIRMVGSNNKADFTFEDGGYGVVYEAGASLTWYLSYNNNQKQAAQMYAFCELLNSTSFVFSNPIALKAAKQDTFYHYLIAGSTSDDLDGVGSSAGFIAPSGLALGNGGVYVGGESNRIRFLTFTGIASTVAGTALPGSANSLNPLQATFRKVKKLASDDDAVYIADTGNYRIRTLRTQVGLLAGSTRGYLDATGSSAQFHDIAGITVLNGTVFVSDAGNHRVRKITPEGVVTTLAGGIQGDVDGVGTSARFNYPAGLDYDEYGNIYVADRNNHKIKRITPTGQVTTFAGSGLIGHANGYRVNARFEQPIAVSVVNAKDIYIAEYNGIRRILSDYVTLISDAYQAPEAILNVVDENIAGASLVVADISTNSIYMVQSFSVSITDLTCGGSYTIGSAGGFNCTYSTDPPNQAVKFYLSASNDTSGIVYSSLPSSYKMGDFNFDVLSAGYTFQSQEDGSYLLMGTNIKVIGDDLYLVGVTMGGTMVFSTPIQVNDPFLIINCDSNVILNTTRTSIDCVVESSSSSPVSLSMANASSIDNVVESSYITYPGYPFTFEIKDSYTLASGTKNWYISNGTHSIDVNTQLFFYGETQDGLLSAFSAPIKANMTVAPVYKPPVVEYVSQPVSTASATVKAAQSNASSGFNGMYVAIIASGGFILAMSAYVFVRARNTTQKKVVKKRKTKKVAPTLPQVQLPGNGAGLAFTDDILGEPSSPQSKPTQGNDDALDFLEIPME